MRWETERVDTPTPRPPPLPLYGTLEGLAGGGSRGVRAHPLTFPHPPSPGDQGPRPSGDQGALLDLEAKQKLGGFLGASHSVNWAWPRILKVEGGWPDPPP